MSRTWPWGSPGVARQVEAGKDACVGEILWLAQGHPGMLESCRRLSPCWPRSLLVEWRWRLRSQAT